MKGKFVWSEEKFYEGDWKDNSITGFGVFNNNGLVYKGYFYSDKKNGYGMTVYPNGSHVIGKWNEDEMDGLAIFLNEQGVERLIQFKKGKDKVPVTDPDRINTLKHGNEYSNLMVFLENMRKKGLY